MKRPNHAASHIRWMAFSVLFPLASSASAHHATATEYDISKIVTLKGRISRVDWANPHIHVYVEMKSERGAAQAWDVEFPSPGAAIVAGLSKQSLANGVLLTFEGYLSKPDFHPDPRRNSGQDEHAVIPRHFACATGVTFPGGNHFTFVVGI